MNSEKCSRVAILQTIRIHLNPMSFLLFIFMSKQLKERGRRENVFIVTGGHIMVAVIISFSLELADHCVIPDLYK